jgi:hypothetical protein
MFIHLVPYDEEDSWLVNASHIGIISEYPFVEGEEAKCEVSFTKESGFENLDVKGSLEELEARLKGLG